MFSKRKQSRKDESSSARSVDRRRATFESLEFRQLLSGTLDDLANIIVSPSSSRSATTAAVSSSIAGYTPEQIRKAYGFDQVTLANGVKGDGSGQTIAIVTAYNDPNIVSDLHTFDSTLGVADDFSLSVVSQTGGKTSSIPTDAGWAEETALDVEWAHAIAPKAKILLVEANSASLGNLLSAVDYARHAAGVSVVSMSWGADEFWSQTAYDKYFTTPAGHQGVTFVAASGDEGSMWGPSWPSSSSNVLAVGGTTLNIDPTTGAASETGWSGSGGGVSSFEYEPSYQAGAQRTGARTAPDVSYDANPYTGFAFYNSVDDGSGDAGWGVVGGTSAGTPQWAALIAIANQGRAAVGKGSLDGATGTLPTLYALYNNPTAYAAAFNDVTVGRSSFFLSAHAGYDGVTGLGTPKAAGVVGALIGNTATKTTTTTTTTTTTVAAATTHRTRTTATQRSAQSVTTTTTTTTTTTDNVVVAPPRAAIFTARTTSAVLALEPAAAGGAGNSSGSFEGFGSGGGAASGNTRNAFASGRKISATYVAGYEPARGAKPLVTPIGLFVDPGRAGAAKSAAASAQAGTPWVLMGVAPADNGTIPGLGDLDGGALGSPTAPQAVADVPGVTLLSTPKAIAVSVAAIAVEVFVLYRRARRQTTAADGANTGMSPLERE